MSTATLTKSSSTADQKKILKSIVDAKAASATSAKTPMFKLNDPDEGEDGETAAAAATGGSKVGNNKDPSIVYYSGQKKTDRHKSVEQEDDEKYIENVLNAKDRRQSWQQVRTQRSYIPSLSVICKCFSMK
jgi:hypothetical protein